MKKRFLALLLSALLLFPLCVPALAAAVYQGQFSDVSDSQWFSQYVQITYDSGLMQGISSTRFDPDGNLTAAQAITIAARLHSRYSGGGDLIVSGTPWYQPYVEYAERSGILVPGKAYDYDSPIFRADFVQLISNALPDGALPAINSLQPGDIPDVSTGVPMMDAMAALMEAGTLSSEDISYAAMMFTVMGSGSGDTVSPTADAIYRLYQAGVLSGNDSYGTFAPKTNLKRSEAAAIISRVLEPSLRKRLNLQTKPVSLVPLDRLANRRSLQSHATNAQLSQAYEAAREIVEPLAGLSPEAQLYGVAIAVRVITENSVDYSMSSPHYDDPYGFFILHSASCAGSTRATGLCLNMLGIPYEHVNENAYTHQWCRVNLGGTHWICDAFGLCCGPEPAPYTHPFL